MLALGKLVTLCASITKQYNLVLAKRQQCSSAGKVTAGLAESKDSLLPCFITRPAGGATNFIFGVCVFFIVSRSSFSNKVMELRSRSYELTNYTRAGGLPLTEGQHFNPFTAGPVKALHFAILV